MDDLALTKLLLDMESDRVERKASDSDRNKIRQAVCAFANDLPNHQKSGVIFVGVNDDGSPANFSITDELLLRLSDVRSDGNILPFPVITVSKRNLNGYDMAVIIVEPSDAPPVRFNGRVWIRVGPRSASATAEEERRLSEKRRARDLPFDLRPYVSSTLQDLDLDGFERSYLPLVLPIDVLEENQRSIEQRLMSMRFITVDQPYYPTALGLMVIGKDTRQFVPGFYIQFLRIDGIELGDPIKGQKLLDGSLLDVLRQVDEVVEANISVASDITTSVLEIQQADYPMVALQQLIRNAVMHRAYDETNAPIRLYWFNDRIEIQSPGGLYGQVNRGNFGKGVTDYRNPHLAEVMYRLGYVQRFGYGIPTSQRALSRNGNPIAEFEIEETYLSVILRKRP
jgi:ATP-dependent DNA helicase RecG